MSSKYNRKTNPHYAQRRADSREDHLWKQDLALRQQADKIRFSIPEAVRAEQERVDKEWERLESDFTKRLQGLFADILGAPFTQFAGGVHEPVTLTHWKTPSLHNLASSDAGPLMRVTAQGMESANDAVRASGHPALHGPDGDAWMRAAGEAVKEVQGRYAFLPHLMNNAYTAKLYGAVGLTRDVVETERVDGLEGQTLTVKTTTTIVPTLIAASVTPDGLELTYKHRVGDSANAWNPKLPALVGAFKSLGMRADNLKIKDDSEGNVVLDFDDAPSGFPTALAPAPPATRAPQTVAEASDRYRNARWVLGVDRRGADISLPMEDFQHILVTGETGGGKSVWTRTQIESLRAGDRHGAGGWTVYVLDGKGSDYVSLNDLPNVGMVTPSTDLDLCVWMIHTVRLEMLRRVEEAKAKKAARDPRAYEFPPILLLIDEWGTTATALRAKYGKSAELVFADIDAILRLGREPRVHIALASQNIRKTGPAAVPGSWFVNFKLVVSLGNPDSETLQSAFPDSLRGRAGELGPRIRGKRGRGMFADADHNRVAEFQSYYGWSPGTTSLDPSASPSVRPPTDQVRGSWEAWEPVSASVPTLSPRVAPNVTGPEWRESLDTIFATPAVAISDQFARALPGTEHLDPNSPNWVGAEPVGDRIASVPLVGFADDAPVTPSPAPRATAPETVSPSPADIASPISLAEAMEDPAQRALIAQHLRDKGISVPGLTDADEPDAPEAVDEAPPTPATPAADNKSAAPKTPTEDGDDW